MKIIELSRGMSAKVSDKDFIYLNKFSWYAHHGHSSNLWYARTDWQLNGKHKHVFMHVLLAERIGIKHVDHMDGNGLNNQRSNLREADNRQNSSNKKLYINNKTGYKGVFWRADRCHYKVTISANGHTIYIGSSKDKIEAAKMYNKAAKKYHGKFARLNKL